MPADVTITVDARAVEKHLRDVPKAIASKVIPAALNRTADEALRQVKQDLPRTFTIRTPWVAKGLRTTKATPSKPFARLYHKDPYMLRQDEGGEKRPRDGGHVAVPILGKPRGEIRRKVTRPSQWPGKLPRTYTVQQEGDTLLVFQHMAQRGRRPKGTRRGTPRQAPPSRLMYVLKPDVQVKPRWRFLEQVRDVVHQRWHVNAQGFLDLALAGRLR